MIALALLAVSIVVDAPQREVYVGTPDGCITALALATGAPQWTEPHAGVPLTATARGLVVLELDEPQALRVALRAPRDGRRRLESAPIALPEWAAPGAGAALEVQVALEGTALRVTWHVRASDAAPAAEEGAPAPREASGATRVLGDGTLAPLPPQPPLPEKLAALETVPVRVGSRVAQHPFIVGNEVVALRRQGDALLFERYTLAGARLGRRIVFHGAAPALASLTGDELAVELPGPPSRVMLLRVPTGLTLATVSVPPLAQQVQLVAGHVVYVDGDRLKSVDGRSGAGQWEYALPADGD
jgi:hypothetical protein